MAGQFLTSSPGCVEAGPGYSIFIRHHGKSVLTAKKGPGPYLSLKSKTSAKLQVFGLH